MGVLPLQFSDGESAESLGLTGRRSSRSTGSPTPTRCRGRSPSSRRRQGVRGHGADRHAQGAALLPPRRDPPVRAPRAAALDSPAMATPELLHRLLVARRPVRARDRARQGLARRLRGLLRRRPRRRRRLVHGPGARDRGRPDAGRDRPHRRDRRPRHPHRGRRLPALRRGRWLGSDRAGRPARDDRHPRRRRGRRDRPQADPPASSPTSATRRPRSRTSTSTSAPRTATRPGRWCGSATSA